MSWLKLDDGFDTHPKILGLKTDARRWTWQRILIYTCRYRSPIIPTTIADVVPKATKTYLQDCVALGLIDVDKDGVMKVHDWRIYNGETVADKVAAYLAQKPDATANEVHKAIGGKREVVLAVYAQLVAASSSLVPERFPNGTPEVPDQSTPLVPLARAGAPDPDPSLDLKSKPPSPNPVVDVGDPADETSRLELVERVAAGKASLVNDLSVL